MNPVEGLRGDRDRKPLISGLVLSVGPQLRGVRIVPRAARATIDLSQVEFVGSLNDIVPICADELAAAAAARA